ncbi:hypothetical protein HK096_009232, partial [Nowakowskiella sp. JEL0078]
MKLNCKFESLVFSVDIGLGQTVSDLKKEIFKELAKPPVAAIELILARVFKTKSKSGVDEVMNLSEMVQSVLDSLAGGIDVEKHKKFENQLPGLEWTSKNGVISAKVLSASGKCTSYGLIQDSAEFTVDVVVIMPDTRTRESDR